MKRVPKRRLATAAVVAGLALVAAGCGGTDANDGAGGGAGSGVDDAAESAEVLASSVFTGSATTLDGESLDFGTLAGKDLVVWFWAPW